MIEVTVVVGANSRTLTLEPGATVGSVLSNPTYRNALRFPENSATLVDGLSVDSHYTLSDGDELVVERQTCQKA